ncbi:MAG: exo-beta-N-acetylmuramidase NamZ family protein [Candidatus Ratteibacteria bacterium]
MKTGLEVLQERNFDILRGKRIGVITNQTGIDSSFNSVVDILRKVKDVTLVCIFSPEHGFFGGVQGNIDDTKDSEAGIPIFSLYGSTRSIPEQRLKDIDVIVYDIQDIGSRSYTYISTMKLAMEQAAKYNKEFVVFDRPNPVNGLIVDGPVLDPKFKSFIGIAEIPYVHGMTAGELALFFNSELNINCKLTVVPMENWKRNMTWQDTFLPWIPTSPHIPESDTPWFYPITGVIGELSLVSVGVGYTLPFKIIGAPWIDAKKFTSELNSKKIEGVYFHPFYFKPYYGIFKDQFCQGARIVITDKNKVKPFLTAVMIMEVLKKLYPGQFDFSRQDIKNRIFTFDNACGTDIIRKKIDSGENYLSIEKWYSSQIVDFLEKRKKYLLY